VFLVAAVFEFTGKRYQFKSCPTTLVGATLPGPLVALGTVLLIFDLGAGLREPWRIFYMFTHFSSVMTWGIWILSIFIPLAFIYGFLEIMHSYPAAWEWLTGHPWARWLAFLQRLSIRRVKRVIAAVGSIFAVATALYTGVLLSAVGPAIPFWSAPLLPFAPVPMMPLLFLASAISTGVGLTVDLATTLTVPNVHHHVRRLPLIHLALIGAEILLVGLLLISALVEGGAAAQAARDVLMGSHRVVFWALIVLPGFFFPFIIHAYALTFDQHSLFASLGSGLGVVVAGLFLRYLVLISGIPVAL
jgi:formate-dependent nitrite reductase membrane component NrfD